MSANRNANLAFVVVLSREYDITRLTARICEADGDGDFDGMGSYGRKGYPHGKQYDGFQVAAYVDRTNWSESTAEPVGIWGMNYRYDATIETSEQAREIMRVLSTVEKSLEKQREAQGYLKEGDYAQYLFRVATALRIPAVYFRPSRRQREMTGDKYKKVNAAELQSLLAHMVDEVHAGKVDQYTR